MSRRARRVQLSRASSDAVGNCDDLRRAERGGRRDCDPAAHLPYWTSIAAPTPAERSSHGVRDVRATRDLAELTAEGVVEVVSAGPRPSVTFGCAEASTGVGNLRLPPTSHGEHAAVRPLGGDLLSASPTRARSPRRELVAEPHSPPARAAPRHVYLHRFRTGRRSGLSRAVASPAVVGAGTVEFLRARRRRAFPSSSYASRSHRVPPRRAPHRWPARVCAEVSRRRRRPRRPFPSARSRAPLPRDGASAGRSSRRDLFRPRPFLSDPLRDPDADASRSQPAIRKS